LNHWLVEVYSILARKGIRVVTQLAKCNDKCDFEADRDLNAAINIEREGIRLLA
jgi:transposase